MLLLFGLNSSSSFASFLGGGSSALCSSSEVVRLFNAGLNDFEEASWAIVGEVGIDCCNAGRLMRFALKSPPKEDRSMPCRSINGLACGVGTSSLLFVASMVRLAGFVFVKRDMLPAAVGAGGCDAIGARSRPQWEVQSAAARPDRGLEDEVSVTSACGARRVVSV